MAKNPAAGSSDLDRAIGQRLRAIRWMRQRSMQDLAAAAGISWQQIQKFETGANRLSLSTAVRLCDFLGVSVSDLLPDEGAAGAPWSREGAELARTYDTLADDKKAVLRAVLRAL